MKRIVFVVILNCLANIITAQNWIWGEGTKSGGTDCGSSIITDYLGNSYITGNFTSGTIIFGHDTLTNYTGTGGADVFLVKYNPMGNVLWVKSFFGLQSDQGAYITKDILGNIYLAGYFNSPKLICGADTLINLGPGFDGNAFLIKCDSSGNVIWANSLGGKGEDVGLGVTVDDSLNIYFTGSFGADTLIVENDTVKGRGGGDFFLVKYNSFGKVIWARGGGGLSSDKSNSVSADAYGNVYITGSYISSWMFIENDTLDNFGGYDVFIAKYDSSGTFIWARNIGGPNDDMGFAVVNDSLGNLYTTGYFQLTVLFSSDTLISYGHQDVYLIKYNKDGNVIWAKSAGGAGSDEGYGLVINSLNSIYLTGNFSFMSSNSISFGTNTLPYQGGLAPIFVAQYDSMGNVGCISSLTSGGNNIFGLSHDGLDNVYIVSSYVDNSFVVGNDTLTRWGTSNVFVAKFTCSNFTAGVVENFDEQKLLIYPNPSDNNITVQSTKELGAISIYNTLGEMALQSKSRNIQEQIDISKLPTGVYIIEVQGRYSKLVKE